MYSIKKTSYGVSLTFGGSIKQDEMAKWVTESEATIRSLPASFCVFVDMRTLAPLSPEAQAEMKKGQVLYKARGMERSVVIVNSAITKMQFTRLAKETGIYQWERYVDAASMPNWQKVGDDWLIKSIDPDK